MVEFNRKGRFILKPTPKLTILATIRTFWVRIRIEIVATIDQTGKSGSKKSIKSWFEYDFDRILDGGWSNRISLQCMSEIGTYLNSELVVNFRRFTQVSEIWTKSLDDRHILTKNVSKNPTLIEYGYQTLTVVSYHLFF